MKTTTVCLTVATAYSIYILVCILFSPTELGGFKGLAGLFIFSLGLFAIGDKKIKTGHVARSAVIAVSVGLLLQMVYFFVVVNLHNFGKHTLFSVPVLLFSPTAACAALLAFILIRARSKNARK